MLEDIIVIIGGVKITVKNVIIEKAIPQTSLLVLTGNSCTHILYQNLACMAY